MTSALHGVVLNVDVGAGHRRAAEGLRDGIRLLRPGSELELIEALDYLGAEVATAARDLYFGGPTPPRPRGLYKQ